MNYIVQNTRTESEIQRDYLTERLARTFREKDRKLEVQFGMRDEPAPLSFDDMVARIKGGKFSMSPVITGDETIRYDSPYSYIKWGTTERDPKGYEDASEALKAKYQTTLDIIKIKSLDDGLTALQSFESA